MGFVTFNQVVEGSSPSALTSKINHLAKQPFPENRPWEWAGNGGQSRASPFASGANQRTMRGTMSKDRFAELADELRALIERERTAGHPPSITRDSAAYLLEALAAFKRDAAAGLDRAFGLSTGPGRPAAGTDTENYAVARAIYFMRWQGKTWGEIAEHYHGERDIRDLRNILKRYNSRVSAELVEKIADHLETGRGTNPA